MKRKETTLGGVSRSLSSLRPALLSLNDEQQQHRHTKCIRPRGLSLEKENHRHQQRDNTTISLDRQLSNLSLLCDIPEELEGIVPLSPKASRPSILTGSPVASSISSSCCDDFKSINYFFDSFIIGNVIGTGKTSRVYKCQDKSTNEIFAVKIIDKAAVLNHKYIRQEVSLMRSLGSCPNILSLHEVFESREDLYIVLEYCDTDVFTLLQDTTTTLLRHVKSILKQLLAALVYIHAKNIIHRDIKLENLLLKRNANGALDLKLADFGIARTMNDITGSSTTNDGRSRATTSCGSPNFAAPEVRRVCKATGYGNPVDIYSTGVVAYVLLTNGDVLPTGAVQHSFEEIHDKDARDFLKKALEHDPEARMTAEEALEHPWLK